MSYLLQILIVLATVAAGLSILRVREPGLRLRVLQAALLLCLLLPFLRVPAGTIPAGRFVAEAGASVDALAASAVTFAVPWRMLWACGAAVLLVRLALGWIALRRLARESSELEEREGVTIRLSDAVSSPVAFGRTVLLPRKALAADAAVREPMIAHEMEHIRRGDWAQVIAEEVGRAMLWFHPLVWWLMGRIRMERERAVDAAVTRRVGADAYSESLLTAAEWRADSDLQPFPATAMYSGGSLGRRLQLIQNNKETHMTLVHRAVAISALSIATAGVVLTTAVSGVPLRAANAAQEEQVEKPTLTKKVTPQYPSEAKQARVQGTVKTAVTIGKDGSVVNVEVVDGPAELREAAVTAVKQWEFTPGKKDGKAVEVHVEIEINFTLAP